MKACDQSTVWLRRAAVMIIRNIIAESADIIIMESSKNSESRNASIEDYKCQRTSEFLDSSSLILILQKKKKKKNEKLREI